VAALPGIVWGLPAGRILAGLGVGEGRRRAVQRVALAGAACVEVVLTLRVVNDAYYIASRRPERFGVGWNRLELPIDAVRHADRAGLRGPVLNHLNFGGYLMWARRDPVFIDGRLEVVGEEFYNEYRSALGSQAAFDSCVARYNIRWIIFPYATLPELLGRVSRDAKWRLAYVDHLAAVFVLARAGGAATDADPDPGLLKREPARPIPVGSLPRLDGRAYPTPLTRWLRGLAHREEFPFEDFNLGLFHIYRGEPDRAAALFARAIERSGGAYYEIYSNLGAALFRARRLVEARECYRVVLEERPGDPIARDRVATIERSLAQGSASAPPATLLPGAPRGPGG
jgi:tetratricopeptide (TPR) repeat protein